MIESLIISLICTIIIEIIVSIIIGIRNKKDLLVIILANTSTNPIVVYIANLISLFNNAILYWSVVIILESMVVIVEYKIIKNFLTNRKTKALYLALFNNIISFGIRCSYKYFYLRR